MLLQLRQHLHAAGPTTLLDLAAHFDVEPEAAEGLLEVLIRRGDAVRETFGADCTGCGSTCSGACRQKALMIYRASGQD